MWGYGLGYSEEQAREAFQTSLSAGINLIDTAEIYGNGKSERLVGQFVREAKQPVIIATKFFPFPWRLRRKALINALRASLARLGMKQVDLYQIHWPYPPVSLERWAEGLAEAVELGLTKAVGVSNFNPGQMRRVFDTLARHGLSLTSNQMEYSLLARGIERNGLLELCQELGVTIIAYSPLAKGMLTGKYTPENPPPGLRARRYSPSYLAKVQPLIQRMHEIGHGHGSKTPSQVALNWLMCKGAIPIPGAKNARQAQENAGALGWNLSPDEVAALDEASQDL
jgi:aryl-alcohol dehydrogenase-like predicted oxidoreductase